MVTGSSSVFPCAEPNPGKCFGVAATPPRQCSSIEARTSAATLPLFPG